MVSIISMPATVAPASLPASRIWTRVRLIRFFEMKRENTRLTAMEDSPTAVSSTL